MWCSGPPAASILRRWEKNVLDPFHTTLRLWQHDRDAAHTAFIHLTDHIQIRIASALVGKSETPGLGWTQRVLNHLDAVARGSAWLRRKPAGRVSIPVTNLWHLNSPVLAFFDHAVRYSSAELFHVAFSRGACDVDVDETTNTVRFRYAYQPGELPAAASLVESATTPVPPSPTPFTHPGIRVTSLNNCIRIIDPRALRPLIADHESRFRSMLALEMTGAVSASALHRFLSALYTWNLWNSVYCTLLTHQHGRNYWIFPTQHLTLHEFIDFMCIVTSLTAYEVARIAELFTSLPMSSDDAILYKPLMVENGMVLWSSRLLEWYDESSVLRCLARTPGTNRAVVDFIGRREVEVIDELVQYFGQRGYVCCPKRELSAGGEHGEIDLLVWREAAPTELLIIEVKAILFSRRSADLYGNASKIVHGQEQIKKATRMLRNMRMQDAQAKYPAVSWKDVKSIYGIVVMRNPGAAHTVLNTEVPVADLSTVRYRLTNEQSRTPAELYHALRERRWLGEHMRAMPNTYIEVPIGGVKYQLPSIVMMRIDSVHGEKWPDGIIPYKVVEPAAMDSYD